MAAAEETQITCKFVTKLPEKYRISPTPFAVPGKLTRYGLSEVINHLLDLGARLRSPARRLNDNHRSIGHLFARPTVRFCNPHLLHSHVPRPGFRPPTNTTFLPTGGRSD